MDQLVVSVESADLGGTLRMLEHNSPHSLELTPSDPRAPGPFDVAPSTSRDAG